MESISMHPNGGPTPTIGHRGLGTHAPGPMEDTRLVLLTFPLESNILGQQKRMESKVNCGLYEHTLGAIYVLKYSEKSANIKNKRIC